jgi:hypothetical protein
MIRFDWRGEKHVQTFSELERQFPHVKAGHLANLCRLIQKNNSGNGTATASGKTLLQCFEPGYS